MTYQEFREQQRIRDQAHIGPGCYRGNSVNFGEDAYYKVTISASKKYFPKKEDGPGPDTYNPKNIKKGEEHTKPRTTKNIIISSTSRMEDQSNGKSPDPGEYQRID